MKKLLLLFFTLILLIITCIASFLAFRWYRESQDTDCCAYIGEDQNLSEIKDENGEVILTIFEPKGDTVSTETFTFKGRVAPGSKVTIQNQDVEIDLFGNFSKQFIISKGDNLEIEIDVEDKDGNVVSKVYKYIYSEQSSASSPTPNPTVAQSQPSSTPKPSATNPPAPTATNTPVPTAPPSCSGSFTNTLLCLINNHRNANGLNSLALDSNLNNAAQGHSNWMNTNGVLDHTGEGGSSPWQRCITAGTTCDAENVAQHSSPTAQNIFNLWRNSSGHNTNMLGSHTHIGIGISGGYVTAVFR